MSCDELSDSIEKTGCGLNLLRLVLVLVKCFQVKLISFCYGNNANCEDLSTILTTGYKAPVTGLLILLGLLGNFPSHTTWGMCIDGINSTTTQRRPCYLQ
jgi:hypothetical protein